MSDPTGATAGSQYIPGFRANLNLLPQQTQARLLPAVDSDLAYDTPGQFFNADDVGSSDPQDVTTRVPASPTGFVDMLRRFGSFKGYNDGKFIDNEDLVRELTDPTSKVMQAMNAGKGRKMDNGIIGANGIGGLMGTYQYQDQNQNYQVGAANANIIAANDPFAHQAETIAATEGGDGNYGLTIGKLIQTKTNLDNSEIDEPVMGDRPSDYFFACTATQLQNLLQSVPATNSFYNSVQGLVEGTLSYFMGFNFIRLPANAIANPLAKTGFTRKCLAWHRRALVYRARPIITARITQREDYSFRWYAYYETEHGAVRHYDGGVWEVDCSTADQTAYT